MLRLLSTIHFQLTELLLLLANFFIFIARVRDRFFSPKHARRREEEWKRHKLLIFDDKLVSLPPSILSCWVDAQVSESGCFPWECFAPISCIELLPCGGESNLLWAWCVLCGCSQISDKIFVFQLFCVNVRVWNMETVLSFRKFNWKFQPLKAKVLCC